MRYVLSLLSALVLSSTLSHAADPLDGSTWRTFDDKTGLPKVIVQFKQTPSGLTGTIIKRLSGSTLSHCSACSGSKKNQALVGLQIIDHLKPQGSGEYADGNILDPKSGKVYSLHSKMSTDGQTLDMRGYIGFSLLGRTQVWKREP